VPGDFERFVQRQAAGAQTGVEIRRFGAEVLARSAEAGNTDASPVVPPDYAVAPGDEILVTIWGSVDADLRLVVDRAGRINIPRVGTIAVSGVRHAELTDHISRRVAQVFKNYQLSVSLGALRGIRIFVTGFVTNPGAFQVTSLSTITAALIRAGGPSAGGSFRHIELRRGGQVVSTFDLYDFMLKGDRSADRLLQAGDVVHVMPVGTEIGLIGSIHRPAVLELKAGETVADVLRMGGGFTAVADRARLAVERLSDRNAKRIRELALPADLRATLDHGDVLRAFSAVDAVLPVQQQNKRVRVEGEVARPGDYVLPASSTLEDALQAAGGLTGAAYVFGAEFSRDSVRASQQENYERALRDLETEFARQGAQRTSTADEAAAAAARGSATTRLIERLRTVRPTGIVLQLNSDAVRLPALALEDGDRIFIPPTPSTVGVFGSVFNAGSYLFSGDRRVEDYLRLAGGATRGADQDSTFVIRANGSVVSNLQGQTNWWQRGTQLNALKAEPGDTIFVPEEVNKTTFIQSAKDWTQVLYQFGVGLAAIITVTK
jgi:protein involved in polysaccharide export with SLBB domain